MNLPAVTTFDEKHVDLIRQTIAKDASPTELSVFLHQCKRTGLDPLLRQIYFQKRSGQMVIMTGIDGYRLIAERSGAYAGSDDATFSIENDDLVAKVTVYKMIQGQRCAFSASARLSEYKPKSNRMWDQMPRLMLSKVAEALALRKAFPADLSGLYTKEEMDQAVHTDEAAKLVREVVDVQQVETREVEPVGAVADYVITIGKYAGQSLSQVGPENVQRFLSYFEDQERKTKKPIEGKLKEVLEHARAYLAELEMGRGA